ncbi:FHA domain-containing protein [Cellulomonas sp. H30R-01]|uniref:RDD family protein n=1 Tax=Cellulomonas sp. H30R-01 TaxID=2704467 RepID=UPI00138DAC25|nr:RDD family protein [Cellulomonas sp. H30R-01]QHT56660.1 FHA domain-containing protein [Cellulomonas sp. H30R-01]
MSTPPVEPQRPRVARGPAPRSVAGGVPVAPDEVAPVVRRFLAYVVDGAVLGAVYGIGTAIALAAGAGADGRPSGLMVLPGVLALLVGVGQWCAEAITGATVGGAALGIRTVAVRTGLPAGLLAILLRNLVVAAGVLVCFVGQVVVVISGVWDREPAQRGWHDKAAGTLVVRAGALRAARGGHGRRVAADGSRRSAAVRPDARAAWETAVARGVEPGRPVPPAPPGPPAPLHGAAPAPAAPPLASPPPSAAADHQPAPPPPAFVEGPPPTAVVPMVPTPAPPGGGLVDVPAGLAGEHRDAPLGAGPVIDAVPVGPAPTAPVVARPGLVDVPETVTGTIPLVPVARRPAPASAPAPGPAPADGLGEVEQTRLREPAAPPVEPLTPSGPAGLEHPVVRDEPAGGLGDLEQTRLVGTAGRSVDRAPVGLLRLVFDTGQRVVVEGDGLVGRDPSDAGVTHVVAVDDPQRSVSKVHLAFGPTGDGQLWVVDRGSTNGTVLVGPDGAGSALTPGARAVVEAGWTIRFGQRAARVERA